MPARDRLKQDFEALKAELVALREPAREAAHSAAETAEGVLGPLERDAKDLADLVHQMIEDAEQTVKDHPGATIAGAIALGIVIGRLTAR
jgi:ElaB/YqjD/DUF883 family membrane-anchored ribosome-binding protein